MKIFVDGEERDMTPEEEAVHAAMQEASPVINNAVPQVISRRQFYQGLAVSGRITKAEALAAVQTGAIPAALQVMVDAMEDEDAKFEASMLLAGAADFDRDHPLVLVIAMAQQMSEAQVDDFWTLCYSL